MSNDWLKYAPKEWREKFEAAAGIPVSGIAADAYGVQHEIVGDYTVCNRFWCDGADIVAGWTPLKEGAAVTCILCHCAEIIQWKPADVSYLETSTVSVPADPNKP